MKVVFVGNCQARPLAMYFEILFGVQVRFVALVHLLKESDRDACNLAFSDCDYLFTQQVSPTYPVDFIRTDVLLERFGAKVFQWVNLYFRGYNPELMYLRPELNQHLTGPLADYHIGGILAAYQKGWTIAQCVATIQDRDWNESQYAAIPEASLAELEAREAGLQVKSAGYLREHWLQTRLFFTFNHPAKELLLEYCRRLGLAAGLRPLFRISPAFVEETLSRIVVPVNPHVSASGALLLDQSQAYKGLETREVGAPGSRTSKSVTRFFGPEELVEAFWRVYDTKPALAASGKANCVV